MIWLSIFKIICVILGPVAIIQPDWFIKIWKVPTPVERAKMKDTGWAILGSAAIIALLNLWGLY